MAKRIMSAAVAATAMAGLALVGTPASHAESRAATTATYTVGINTCDLFWAGTDDDVQFRVEYRSNITHKDEISPWVTLDQAGHNDFEKGVYDQYEVTLPSDADKPHKASLSMKGDGDWCVSNVQFWGPDTSGQGSTKHDVAGVTGTYGWMSAKDQTHADDVYLGTQSDYSLSWAAGTSGQ